MAKRATTKRPKAAKTAVKAAREAKAAKISDNARRRREAEQNRPVYSLDNPPTSFTITIRQLAELRRAGLNQTYDEVRKGLWPALRSGNGPFAVLTVPALQILRGERSPGPTREGEAAPSAQPTPLRRRSGQSEDRTSP